MQILNLGSGSSRKTDILIEDPRVLNADIIKSRHAHIICDANNLPFRSGAFKYCILSHLLEHVENPIQVLKEVKKAISKLIVIRVPNATFHNSVHESDNHIFTWNKNTLKHLLNKTFPGARVELCKTNRSFLKLPLFKTVFEHLFSFRQPNELTAKIYLVGKDHKTEKYLIGCHLRTAF